MIATRRGFSLLEVLLAMSIFLGALVVLGELARIGRLQASRASDLTQAEAICQAILNEVVAGTAPSEPANEAPLEDFPGWLYSLEREPTEVSELVSLRVTVRRDLPEEKDPVAFQLVRWVRSSAMSEGFGLRQEDRFGTPASSNP